MGVKVEYKEQDLGTDTEEVQAGPVFIEAEGVVRETVDAIGELKAKIAVKEKPLKKMKAELSVLEDAIRASGDDFDVDEPVTFKGDVYEVELTKKSITVESIDKDAIYKHLGVKTWFDLTTPGIGDLRKYLTPPQIQKWFNEVRAKNRTIKVTKL